MILIFIFWEEALTRYFAEERQLSAGSRGSVTLLRHRESGQRFVLRRTQGSAAVYEALLPLRSPYLPQVYAVAERDGTVLVLEEYICGDPLDELLTAAPCTPRQTAKIAGDICKALWVLHGLGLVHRDVKPDNILLRGDHAVLLDLDAARIVTPARTADTVVLGTTGYAAPEQYGLSQTDGRADIYALGVTMNIMLTGKHPSMGLAKGRLGKVIRRCTQIAPEQRYPSVEALLRAL